MQTVGLLLFRYQVLYKHFNLPFKPGHLIFDGLSSIGHEFP